MIRVYSQLQQGERWLRRFRGCPPIFACVLGFTATGLIPGISAAGATPIDRQYTAIADAEFLYRGCQPQPSYPLPPLQAGASPTLISRAIVTAQQIPVHLFNAGLPHLPTVPHIDLGGTPARCLSQGKAIDLSQVKRLLEQGLFWGEKLAAQVPRSYLILGECVVGGTTTALAVLTGLGWEAAGKVNSSIPVCNHQQKWEIVSAGLKELSKRLGDQKIGQPKRAIKTCDRSPFLGTDPLQADPLQVVAAVGDPMQIVVAGMAIAASHTCGVMLAGGTQMLAVHALIQSLSHAHSLPWEPEQVVVGTTRWVAEDPTGDTVGLAELLQAPLLATQLSFASSRYEQFRAYEQGYVKEGVGAGGCAIAAHLYQGWTQKQLLEAIEALAEEHKQSHQPTAIPLQQNFDA